MPFFDFWFPHNMVFWGAIVLIVFIASFFRFLSHRSRNRMLERLADKGHSLTPELIDRIDQMKNAD
jgi:hypothetical protein